MDKLSAHRSDVTRFHRYVPSRDDPGFAAENIDISLGNDDDATEKIFEEDIMAKLSAHGSDVRFSPMDTLRSTENGNDYVAQIRRKSRPLRPAMVGRCLGASRLPFGA